MVELGPGSNGGVAGRAFILVGKISGQRLLVGIIPGNETTGRQRRIWIDDKEPFSRSASGDGAGFEKCDHVPEEAGSGLERVVPFLELQELVDDGSQLREVRPG